MIDPAKKSIQILQGAMEQVDLFTDVERKQVERRIAQLNRRAEDPRTFIAFIGEKKAGKTALVKALTGVPLPVAVRECTAAICEIQVGLDWHHHATYSSGEIKNYQPLDDSPQRQQMIEAQRANSRAAEDAIDALNSADIAIQSAEEAIEQCELKLKNAQLILIQSNQLLQEAQGALPWIWSLLSIFSWIGSIKQRIQKIHQAKKDIKTAQHDVEESKRNLQIQKEVSKQAQHKYPEILKKAQSTATRSRRKLEDAKKEMEEIADQNKKQFKEELHSLIDVSERPADRVTIHTPNANIPFNIVLLDTPGFNTDLESHRKRAWEAIEEMADICILVSDLRQPMPDTALNMLERIEPFCPYLHVALTKTDLALAEAEEIGDDPEQEVQEAEIVARNRIKKRWERPMNIWTVASIHEDDKRKTQALFTNFWQNLPDKARWQKSRLLGAHAIRELMEFLAVHRQTLQENLQKFDEVASDVAYMMASQLAEQNTEISEKASQLLTRVQNESIYRLQNHQQEWYEQIEKCETKFQVRKEWEKLQKDMAQRYAKNAQLATKELEIGINKVAKWLWKKDGTLDIENITMLPEEEVGPDEESSSASWVWTMGGAATGAAVGLVLTSGAITIPLLLAAGAGGFASLLLAPLADAKENLRNKIQKSIQKEEESIRRQIQKLVPDVVEKIIDSAEREIKIELEQREKEAREAKQNQIEKVQQLWTYLFEQRQKLLATE